MDLVNDEGAAGVATVIDDDLPTEGIAHHLGNDARYDGSDRAALRDPVEMLVESW